MIIYIKGVVKKMKQIRHGVFETNSSSTHSLTLEYSDRDLNSISSCLPYNNSKELKYLDILKHRLIQDGITEGEIDKLRVIVALITEYVYDEYILNIKKEYCEKHGMAFNQYVWSYEYNDFLSKKLKGKMARNYIYNHRFWKYLNSVLKKKLNINIKLYDTFEYFPYISEFVDEGLGCESSQNYKELGFSNKMTKESFCKKIEDVLFNKEVLIFQETYRN